MVCPYCESKTQVSNSRAQKRTAGIWRRRRCLSCSAIFTTEEQIDYSTVILVKKGPKTSPFSRDTLLISISDCTPTPLIASKLTDTVITRLLSTKQALITTEDIKATVEHVLSAYSPKAGLKYLSTQESNEILRKKLRDLPIN